jgi:signal transduction histidine kinase/ActR/RegA family two-component response regulator
MPHPAAVNRVIRDGAEVVSVLVERANSSAQAIFFPEGRPTDLDVLDVRELLAGRTGQEAFRVAAEVATTGSVRTGLWPVGSGATARVLEYAHVPVPPDHTMVYLWDVTERERALAEARESRRSLELAVESSPDGLVLLTVPEGDGPLVVELANARAARLSPLLRAGTRLPAGMSWLARAAADAVRTRRRLVTSDVMDVGGKQVPVSLTAAPAGEARAIVTFRDESDRAELRDAVAAAFDQAAAARRLLYDSLDRIDLPLTVYEVQPGTDGPGFVVRFANHAAVGRSVTQVVGLDLEEVHPDSGRTGLRAALVRAVERAAAVRFVWSDPDDADGRLWDALAAPVGEGHVITVLVDMTERRRTEQELRTARDAAVEALAAKSRFLSTVTHELRTPLTTVIASSELLLDSALDLDQAGLVTQQREAAALLLSLINSTLDLAQLESGRATLERTLFDLDGVRRTVLAVAEPLLAPGVELSWAVAPEVPRSVVGDPLRFTQAVSNLVTNAVKFTESGSVDVVLDVASRTRGQVDLVVSVHDTGPGIGPDELTRVFEPFSQADPSVRRTSGGSGLGLAITQDLVSLMGGRITVESEVGSGTTFVIAVPMRVVADQAPQTSPPGAPDAHPIAGRVLLVDDTVINRTMVAAMLRKRGLDVLEASDGAEAVAIAAEAELDLVLMDLRMPVMDGYDATRAIRAGEGVRRVPVIALTASVSAEVESDALAAGMDAVLSKPVDQRALDEVVRAFRLAGREPRDQGAEVPERP